MSLVTKLASTVLPIAAAAGLILTAVAAPAAAATRHMKVHAMAPYMAPAGRALYNVAPQSRTPVNSDDPALTGGGSLGYNQNIYNW